MTGPDYTIDYDRSANLGSFDTYGFPEELGTDRAGYSTLITTYFKSAVNREMSKRGYTLDEKDPDLLVNFFANGLYGAWPMYGEDVDTVYYKVGTVNIDIVDAELFGEATS